MTAQPARRQARPLRVLETRPAGEQFQVVSMEGGRHQYRRQPCGGCPWVAANLEEFPAEAFKHSARTAYDMADHVFSCHESGTSNPSTCAGFLLRGADHNLAVRLRSARGELDWDSVHDDGRPLHESYRAMAIANGVDPDDPAIGPCRP